MELCKAPNGEAIFLRACTRLPRDGVQAGLSLDQLKRILSTCERMAYVRKFNFDFPFEERRPSSNGHFWKSFDHLLNAEDTRCAIVRLNHPVNHWTVVRSEGTRLAFYDSIYGRKLKNRGTIASGTRHENKNVWLIDRGDVVLVQVKSRISTYRGPPW